MTLAAFVAQLRQRVWGFGSAREGPETRALLARLVGRANDGSDPTPEQMALLQILDALRVPERALQLPDRIVDQLSAQSVFEIEALVDQIDRGLITPGAISTAIRRVRIHAVPPDR